MKNFEYDDDEKAEAGGPNAVHHDFQCPSCDAHNPYEEGFRVGDEISCFYCGVAFEVREQNGKLKFREA